MATTKKVKSKITTKKSSRINVSKKITRRNNKRVRISKRNLDFYQKLTKKINKWLNENVGRDHKWVEYIMLAPNLFHLLIRLIQDPDIPIEEKGKLLIAIAYFILPIDFIPEGFLGPAAYVDDVALTCYALNSLINKTNPALIEKYWAGDKDILKVIKDVLKYADEMIGSGRWAKIKKLLSGK